MAERRMFSKTIIDSDIFLDMPLSTQALYFHLSMRADDEGFINNPKRILRMIGACDDDIKLLIAKQFIIPFDSGIVVVKHWRIHNYIQKDRFKPTKFVEEKSQIEVESNGEYIRNKDNSDTHCIQPVSELYTGCIPNGYQTDTQVRLGKDRVSIGKDKDILLSTCVDSNPQIDYQKIVDLFNSTCTSLPKIQKLTDLRKQKIKKADKELNGDFESFFRRIEKSDFLTGRNGNWNGCNFDWILKPSNLIKIIEGNYDDDKNGEQSNTDNKSSFSPDDLVGFSMFND